MSVHINDSSVWRAFEDSELTHSAAHYLTTIMHLRRKFGYARVTDVAEHLRVSRGAASRAIQLLKERGWIEEDPNRMLLLTGDGDSLARGVERNYLIMECFLEDILGIPADAAREDACKMEHLLSSKTSNSLFRLIRVLNEDQALMSKLQARVASFPDDCPNDGNCAICQEYDGCIASDTGAARASIPVSAPGPAATIEVVLPEAGAVRTLADLRPGQRGRVARVRGQGAIHRRLLDMGITRGTMIQVDQVAPLRDPLKVKVRGYDLSLRRNEARMIEIDE